MTDKLCDIILYTQREVLDGYVNLNYLRNDEIGRIGLVLIEGQKILPDQLNIENLEIIHSFETINEWICKSSRDILFLDLNIKISSGWLTKVSDYVKRDMSIGTVSPLLTNDIGYQYNDMMSLDRAEKISLECDLELYPELEIGNIGCLYVCWRTFKYGLSIRWESCPELEQMLIEFCKDVTQIGLRHVISSSFLVYDSVKSVKVNRTKKNPKYEKMIQNILLHLTLINGKKNILYELQADFREDAENNTGGTQLHVKALVKELCNNYNIFVVARDRNYINVTAYLANKEFLFKFSIGAQTNREQLYNYTYKKIYQTIVAAFHIDLIHIHHVLGMTRELFYVGQELGVPIIVSFHDYYFVCPCIKMLNIDEKVCIGKENKEMCNACLSKNLHITSQIDYLRFWREESIKVLLLCNKLVAPSMNTKKTIGKFYPMLENNIEVIEHGVDKDILNGIDTVNPKPKKGFNIAFIGNIGPEKGSKYVYELIKHGEDKINWFIFGNLGEYKLLMLEKSNLTVSGEYKHEMLPRLVKENKIDLVCILSICPETYCYTLSESLFCGIPVLVTDVGALGERVRELGCGWVVPKDCSYHYILNKINDIQKNPDKYNEKKRKVMNMDLRNSNQMANDYDKLYKKEMVKGNCEYCKYDAQFLYNAYIRANYKEIVNEENDLELYKELNAMQEELFEIKNSGAYLLGVKILTKLKIPFKKHIKRFIFRNS